MARSKGRTTVRDQQAIDAFKSRLRQVIEASGQTQEAFAQRIGGYRGDSVSRLCATGNTAMMLPLDMLVGMGRWCRRQGFDLWWLVTGEGSMKAEIPAGQGSEAHAIKDTLICGLLLAVAEARGMDARDLLSAVLGPMSPQDTDGTDAGDDR